MRRAFITVPCKTCHHLPTPPHAVKAKPWSGWTYKVNLRLSEQSLAETWIYQGVVSGLQWMK